MNRSSKQRLGKLFRQLWLCLFFCLMFSSQTYASQYGQTMVVISDLETNWYQLYREWVLRDWREVDRILRPRDLDDLATMLEDLGKNRPIQRLIFFGHGSPGGDVVFFMRNHPHLKSHDFRQLKRNRPNLSQYFSVNAQVEFFNCQIGQNTRLIQAAGDAFLSINGGWVSAYKDNVEFFIAKNRFGQPFIDRIVSPPNKWANYEVKAPRRSNNECGDPSSANYNSSHCKFFRDLIKNYNSQRK